MATFTGRQGVIKIDNTAGTLVNLAEVRSFTVDHTMDTVEDTAMGDSARTYKRGLESATFTAEILYTTQETTGNQVSALALAQEAITVELYPSSDSVSGSGKISGEAIITGYSINSSFDDVVTATVNGTFSGDITFATV